MTKTNLIWIMTFLLLLSSVSAFFSTQSNNIILTNNAVQYGNDSFWSLTGNNIENTNIGDVNIQNDLIVDGDITGDNLAGTNTGDQDLLSFSWANPIDQYWASNIPIFYPAGTRFIAKAGVTPTWTIGYIYEYDGMSWIEIIPSIGYAVWIISTNEYVYYTGSVWNSFETILNHNEFMGLQGGEINQYYHLTYSAYSKLYQQNQLVKTNSNVHFWDLDLYGELTGNEAYFTEIDLTSGIDHTYINPISILTTGNITIGKSLEVNETFYVENGDVRIEI